jgi:peptidoglycan/xylan/chitin deacetylase (PgdA/CDA1 family)
MKTVALTVDVEQDCPPFLQTTRGIEEGLPKLLMLFQEEGITATFFTTGQIAESYPQLVGRILEQGHELGCHGYSHRRFDQMNPAEAKAELSVAKQILDHFGPPTVSFRAPNLALPENYLRLIKEQGFSIDSSQATYKPPFPRAYSQEGRLIRIPATATSSIFRLPLAMAWPILSRHPTPVLFVHPWEFVDMSRTGVRLDCRFNTGEKALGLLRNTIRRFRENDYLFITLREMGERVTNEARLPRM